MQFLRAAVPAVCLLAVAAPAQAPTGAPPGIITAVAKDPVFNAANLEKLKVINTNGQVKAVVQIFMVKTPGVDKDGQWTACVTAYSVTSTYGGNGGNNSFVFMGQYDTTGKTPTFTPNLLAKAMNNTANTDIFGLMIEPRDGLYASVDQGDGVYIGYRPTVVDKNGKGVPFGKPVKCTVQASTTALPTPYIDPTLGYVDGQLHLFYTNGTSSIIMRPLKLTISGGVLTKAECQGNGTAVVNMSVIPHSPTVIVDGTGEVRGLWMAGLSGQDSDMHFKASLNPKEPPLMLLDTPGWMNNGAVIGGRLFFANSATQNDINVVDVSWMVGSITKLGGTATMTVGVANPKQLSPVITTVIGMSARQPGTAAPVTIPGWNGQYGLASVDLQLAQVVSLNKDRIGRWSAPVPNIASLAGIRLSVQGLSKVQGQPLTFTNTATLEFK